MLVIRVFLFAVSLSINLATISRAESSECARISDLASARARWAATRGWMLLRAAALCIALPGLVALLGGSAQAGVTLEERKLPMKFSWVACQPNCRGWVSAVGIVTSDSPRDFDEFARGRQLGGATIVLDSSGGSVNDSIALGRRWRNLGALTTVGISVQTNTAQGAPASMAAVAYCESMCVFLLLSGETRCVPETAHVRVHQIWLGDRADDAKAATYSADDLMTVERDIGRLAKYTFDMGGAGDLLSLSLNVAPWEDLHELSREELRLTNLVTTDVVAQPCSANAAVVELTPKPAQDRFASSAVTTETNPEPAKSIKTAEAIGPASGVTAPAPPANHLLVIRAAAQESRVERIFVNAAIKKALCREAKGDRSWLPKVRPMYGHDYHFHVRITCPPSDSACTPQPPPSEDEGCAPADFAYGFSDPVIHPRPSTEPSKSAPPITLAQLPATCRQILLAP